MARYVTTNLRFPEETYRELQYQARRRRVPLALLVREAVGNYLGRVEGAGQIPFGDDPADALVASVGGSAGDESINHDHYLYGWSKEVSGEAARGHERAARTGVPGRPESRAGSSVRSSAPEPASGP